MSASATACRGYLAAAADAGLLHHLHGHPFVAGEHHDPLLEERQLLIEFCAEDLLADPHRLGEIIEVASQGVPGADTVLVRVPESVRLPGPWRRHTTYLRCRGPLRTTSSPPQGVVVRRAGPERGDADVARWLAKAFVDGSADHGLTADAGMAGDVARQFLDAADRVSYVACLDSRVIGHATLLCSATDSVTGRQFVELVDVMVEAEDAVRRRATGMLTEVASVHAHGLGLPLIGNVIHPAAHGAPGQGDRIVASLVARGWVVDHVFWRLSGDKGGRGGA
jgi:hypothetical protein